MTDWQLSQSTVDFRNEERHGTHRTEQLFDPRSTEKPVCPSCGARAKNLCRHDANIAVGVLEPLARRPKGCLASSQLSPNDPLPI